jgi:lysozyme
MTTLTDMLIADEGLELKPYRCTANKLTIGIGRNLEDTGISRDEALYLLSNDIKRVEAALMSSGTFNALDEARQMALINMAFQLGVRGCFAFKRMWAALARKDWQGAHDEALNSNWARQTPNRARRIAAILLTGQIRGY